LLAAYTSNGSEGLLTFFAVWRKDSLVHPPPSRAAIMSFPSGEEFLDECWLPSETLEDTSENDLSFASFSDLAAIRGGGSGLEGPGLGSFVSLSSGGYSSADNTSGLTVSGERRSSKRVVSMKN
jgi:hypothetical protein